MNQSLKTKIGTINAIIFILYLIGYLTVFEFFEKDDNVFPLRHIFLAIALGISIISVLIIHGLKFYKQNLFGKKALLVLPLAIIFLIISIIKAHDALMPLDSRTFIQISLFLLPTLYAFNLLNLMPGKSLIRLLKIATVILIIFYFLEPNHHPSAFLDFNNWLNVDYLSSNSFTESNICAESFLQLFLFFFYVYKYTKEGSTSKHLKLFTILTFIFTVLSFKRLGILFALVILIIGLFINLAKSFKKTRTLILKNLIITIFLVVSAVLYTEFLKGNIFHGANVDQITTNRGYILSLWERQDYYSYGYGTSINVIGRYLEMDLVQILLELGVISLALFCYVYTNLADKRLYSNLVIIYALFNMLTSSTMPWATGWLFLVITIISTSSNLFTLKPPKDSPRLEK